MLTFKCYAKNGRTFYLSAPDAEQAYQKAIEACHRLGTEVNHLVSFEHKV